VKNITEQEAREILLERGHTNIVTFTVPKGGVKEARELPFDAETHEHPFDSDVVIVSGNIKIVVADKEYNLAPGDEFQLGAGIKHSEFMGEDGVTLVAAIPKK
ncbi:uncharacterized protein METZ01_LOCUS359591, partial [marine metagenome]